MRFQKSAGFLHTIFLTQLVQFHVDFQHEGVEINTSLLDVGTLDTVEQQIHEVGLSTSRSSPDVNTFRSGEGLHGGRRGGVVNDAIIRSRISHRGVG